MAVDQVGGCIGGTDGRTRGRNLKRSKGILLIPAAVSVGNLGDEDGDGDDGDMAVILRELPPPDVEEGWLGAKSKKGKSKTNKKY